MVAYMPVPAVAHPLMHVAEFMVAYMHRLPEPACMQSSKGAGANDLSGRE